MLFMIFGILYSMGVCFVFFISFYVYSHVCDALLFDLAWFSGTERNRSGLLHHLLVYPESENMAYRHIITWQLQVGYFVSGHVEKPQLY